MLASKQEAVVHAHCARGFRVLVPLTGPMGLTRFEIEVDPDGRQTARSVQAK